MWTIEDNFRAFNELQPNPAGRTFPHVDPFLGKQYQIAVSDFGNRSGVKIREKFASQRQRKRPRESLAPARFFTRQRTIPGSAPASAPPTASFNSGPRSLLLGEILVQPLLQNSHLPVVKMLEVRWETEETHSRQLFR